MTDIGATLREARMRGHIDISEIESKTKIRAKYLRALENEEWGLLPGPTFVKSFLRTYAEALDLDGKALVEEYRLSHEPPGDTLEPIVAGAQSGRSRQSGPGRTPRGRPSRGYLALVGVISVLIVLLVIGLASGGGGSSSHSRSTASTSKRSSHARGRRAAGGGHRGASAGGSASGVQSSVVSLSIRPTARVYVCLIGEGGKRLIPGSELAAGQTIPTFHAKHFEMTLGNSSVELFIDGTRRIVPASNEPIGYAITKATGRRSLAPGHQPTCT